MRLLIAEDDAQLVAKLKPRLQKAGYAVEWSDNGIDAEFQATENDFDGIVLDLRSGADSSNILVSIGAISFVWHC